MSLRHTCGRFGARLSAVAAEPSFYRSLATKDAEVDSTMAASMISGYRTNNGLTPVTIDPELMKLAEAQAQAMASRDTLSHDVARSFLLEPRRLPPLAKPEIFRFRFEP